MDTLRKAEERSRDAARRGLERAKASWEDSGRELRRKMRVNANSENTQQERRPIISINGKDVPVDQLKSGRRVA